MTKLYKPKPGELKPCPFCHSQRLRIIEYQQRGIRFIVECISCTANGPQALELPEVIVAWNRRMTGTLATVIPIKPKA